MEWHQGQPGRNDQANIDGSLLVLNDLAKRGNGIVPSMVELSLLALLLLGGSIHREADSLLQRLQANLAMGSKSSSSMLSDHTDAVNSGLSDSTELGVGVRADHLNDVWVDGPQELWSKELNHIVKNKKNEFHGMLGLLLGRSWKDFLPELGDQIATEVFVSLEESSKNLSQTNLELMLILVFFFKHSQVLLIKSVLFITVHILLLVLLIILLPVV